MVTVLDFIITHIFSSDSTFTYSRHGHVLVLATKNVCVRTLDRIPGYGMNGFSVLLFVPAAPKVQGVHKVRVHLKKIITLIVFAIEIICKKELKEENRYFLRFY